MLRERVDEVVQAVGGVGRPSAFALHRACHCTILIGRMTATRLLYRFLRAGTWLVDQRRLTVEEDGTTQARTSTGLDTVSRLSRSTSRVPDPEGVAPLDVPLFREAVGGLGSTSERRSSLSSACSVALKRDGDSDTSPGDGLTPLFGARCLWIPLLHFRAAAIAR